VTSKSKVYFFFPNSSFTLKNRSFLKKFIEGIFKKEKKHLKRIDYIFCTDKDLLELNRKYLKHNFYTDILSFNLSDSSSQILAEVYISIERIRENAQTHKSSFFQELHRVIFHGALHLCGYNDKSKRETLNMRKKEDFYLFKFFKSR